MCPIIGVSDVKELNDFFGDVYHQNTSPSWSEVSVLFRREDTKDIVVFVNGLAIIASFLFVPPILDQSFVAKRNSRAR